MDPHLKCVAFPVPWIIGGTLPARSGRPEDVTLRLYFGPSTTDVFCTFRQRYQQTFSGVTFVERTRERRGNVRLLRSHKLLRKRSLNVMNTCSLQKL